MTDDSALQAARRRDALLSAALEAAADAAPSRLPSALAALAAGEPGAVSAIEEAGLSEEALEWVRAHRREDRALKSALEPLAAKAKARRAGRLHLEGDRVLVRARYRKDGTALPFGSPEVQTLFCEVLRLEGLPLELDLGRRPRPLLTCAPPLPPEVAGDGEWLEASLLRSAASPDLLDRLNARLPEGLRLLDWDEAPIWATPIAERCASARWSWIADSEGAESWTAAFLNAASFFLEKVGKVDGQKQDKRLDLRPVVLDLIWEGRELRFTTALGPYAALNPLKLLGAILGRAPDSIGGLRRLGFELSDDPRAAKGDRFTTKLKNMYEDAVPLGASSNITLVDDDEDEPLSLG